MSKPVVSSLAPRRSALARPPRRGARRERGQAFGVRLVLLGGLLLAIATLAAGTALAAERTLPSLPLLKTNSLPPVPVVVVEDAQATEFFQPRADRVRTMVARGLQEFTGQPSVNAAWRSLVGTNDTVAIKVFSAPGSVAGTRLAVAAAVVEELIEAGLTPTNIVVWDKRLDDLERAGFLTLASRYGVRVAGANEASYDAQAFYENPLMGRSALLEKKSFNDGVPPLGSRRSHVTRLLTERPVKVISLVPLLSHNSAGTSGHLFSLATGAVDNSRRFEVNAPSLAVAAPEIFAQANLSDQVVLCLTDALVAQFLGEEEPRLHYSTELRQLWFSRDPVALDTLALQQLKQSRRAGGVPDMVMNESLYRNAALMELGVNDRDRIEVRTVK